MILAHKLGQQMGKEPKTGRKKVTNCADFSSLPNGDSKHLPQIWDEQKQFPEDFIF